MFWILSSGTDGTLGLVHKKFVVFHAFQSAISTLILKGFIGYWRCDATPDSPAPLKPAVLAADRNAN